MHQNQQAPGTPLTQSGHWHSDGKTAPFPSGGIIVVVGVVVGVLVVVGVVVGVLVVVGVVVGVLVVVGVVVGVLVVVGVTVAGVDSVMYAYML